MYLGRGVWRGRKLHAIAWNPENFAIYVTLHTFIVFPLYLLFNFGGLQLHHLHFFCCVALDKTTPHFPNHKIKREFWRCCVLYLNDEITVQATGQCTMQIIIMTIMQFHPATSKTARAWSPAGGYPIPGGRVQPASNLFAGDPRSPSPPPLMS